MLEMNGHLSKRTKLLSEILRNINDGNYEKIGNVWSFGASPRASPARENKDEAIFLKMRDLVYDHVARTVAIQRTSLSSPPTVDSLADEFKKLMGELTPDTREALSQAFGPIVAGQEMAVSADPGGQSQLDALDRYY